jgi:16S rRNA (guanine527-N7)-methyltransferase
MFHVEQKETQSHFLDGFVLGALKLGFTFSSETLEKFKIYYEELCRWDRSINLTGLRTDKERTVLLFLDSLAGCWALSGCPEGVIVDIGTGGGFPGIPLKLALPSLHVLLMEPRSNKTAFLHNVIGKLELTGISVIQSRVENAFSMGTEEEKGDVAFCKGVNIEHIWPFLNHIIKKNGKLVVFRAKNIDNHHRFSHMKVIRELSYELPYGYGSRVLSVLQRQS